MRFGHNLRITEEGFTGSSAELASRRWDSEKRARSFMDNIAFNKDLRCLGPCEKSYDKEGFFCMVFHPKNQLGGGAARMGGER